ncbi:MAG TPA: adenine phosphoribosyltransferase [Marmoricola sp.]|nr:adenine phosphoribosyltransferase [Marmoricola sp.]HNJ78813.1 adenine phosphoribosyltransferase [Marmoricola sp.]HNN49232.1 adenine phosphoribosyltransferase [Marmoricola sp.]
MAEVDPFLVQIRDIADFPKPGVVFKDITPLLADRDGLQACVTDLASAGRDADGQVVVDKVMGLEARGFILGAAVALTLGVGFIPGRKQGKLPHDTHAIDYDLEYGQETLELHVDAIRPGERVLIIDDVLATGGTARAAIELVQRCGGVVHALSVLMELTFLNGRAAIGDIPLRVAHTVS